MRRARLARELSLEDAARATKIRSARLADLEADVYTNFPNLAYARGFLSSYGKYLAVDVRPFLDAFENTSTFGVDDYQYLSETPVGVYRAPRRVWRQRAPRKHLVALGSTIGVLLLAMCGWFFYINFMRLGDLSKLAAQQEQRTRLPAELTPAAILSRPIPSETPSASAAVLQPETVPAVPAPTAAPEPAKPAPAEVAMIDKLAAAPPLTVPDAQALATAPAPASTATTLPPLPEPEPAREHQLVENRTVNLHAAAPAPANARRLSAHPERVGRVSFDTAPPRPANAVKSFE